MKLLKSIFNYLIRFEHNYLQNYMKSKKIIDEFLLKKNIAVVGVSAKGKGFGVVIYNHLKKAGYKVFAVNKNGGNINQDRLYPSLNDIPFRIDGVVTVVHPTETEKIVKEMKSLSINRIWMQQGSESDNAIQYCASNGIEVICGECIMMFVEPVKSIHSFHRWINKLIKKYPV